MDTPEVSIIIPAYNCRLYIKQTIESVLAQDFTNFEILVINDGSTDETAQIAASCGPKVRVIEQENGGVCVARNRGIREARGRFIALLDHDDYWFPNKLSSQLQAFAEHPEVGVVFGDFIRWNVDTDGAFPHPRTFETRSQENGVDETYSGWIYHMMLLDSWVLTSTALTRADVFQACGTFDESLPYSEDWELWLRVSRKFQFLKQKRASSLYRVHAVQGSRMPRSFNYEAALLENTVAKFGYAGPDGRAVKKSAFKAALSRAHGRFGYLHLKNGDLAVARQAFWQAWLNQPFSRANTRLLIGSLLGLRKPFGV